MVTDALRSAYLSITPANMPGATALAAPTTLGAPIGDPQVEGDNLFSSGVYESITSILITGDLTLDAQGDPNASFVFQSASSIGSAPNSRILLAGNAKASNVWWQAGSDATIRTTTEWKGNILAYRDVTMNTGATSCGRLFAGAFTDGSFVFDSNLVSVPWERKRAPQLPVKKETEVGVKAGAQLGQAAEVKLPLLEALKITVKCRNNIKIKTINTHVQNEISDEKDI